MPAFVAVEAWRSATQQQHGASRQRTAHMKSLLLAASAMLMAAPTWAAAADADATSTVKEPIVTATRSELQLTDVPVSASDALIADRLPRLATPRLA
jgi:hypothetical protein